MTTPAPEAPAAPRKENVLTHRLGPLPTWVWVAIAGGAFLAWRWYSSGKSGNQQQQQQDTGTADTSGNTVPQFVNQTYVSTTAPAAEDNDKSSAPTNPSPVGNWPGSQPKPTTTLPGWHYPAPTGLKITSKSAKGVSLAWNAVTGPGGQHPNNYLVATYDSKGKMVNEHGTISGNTNTAEFGPGGRGLHKGTYHTNVWAQGGPVAPPHATVQYTLSG